MTDIHSKSGYVNMQIKMQAFLCAGSDSILSKLGRILYFRGTQLAQSEELATFDPGVMRDCLNK